MAPTALLAEPGEHEQRVVDPERETHAGEHVHDEHRQPELEREQRDEPHPDDDRERCEHDRDEPGDERAEHEHEHDQRGRQPERELRVGEIMLRERGEVVADRVLARDRGGQAGMAVRRLDECHDRLDLRVG